MVTKHWQAYGPEFERVTLAAYAGEYVASYECRSDARASMCVLQKYAAAVRNDPDAPQWLRLAAARVIWRKPKLDAGRWIIVGEPRPLAWEARQTTAQIAAMLP